MTGNALTLKKDPYNLIITGVGGQGNVLASRIIASMLAQKGFKITIGETFGASQRGGSVMSHVRISAQGTWSPQIPKGQADFVVTLEPIEAIRVLAAYGNPQVQVLVNTRPIYPVGVISGELEYPSTEDIRDALHRLSSQTWYIGATDEAIRLGNPVLGNVIMIGALSAVSGLPLEREDFISVISQTMPADALAINMQAFDLGVEKIRQPQAV